MTKTCWQHGTYKGKKCPVCESYKKAVNKVFNAMDDVFKLDYSIINIAKQYDGVAIGGLARALRYGFEKVKDYDIIFPFDKFHRFLEELIKTYKTKNFKINKHGGYRFEFNKIKYDVWSDDLLSLANRTDREWTVYDLNRKFTIEKKRIK